MKRLSWAVQVVARRIPGASCLTQALALRELMERAGHTADLRIGVAKDAIHGFASHAWLEHDSQILVKDKKGRNFRCALSDSYQGG